MVFWHGLIETPPPRKKRVMNNKIILDLRSQSIGDCITAIQKQFNIDVSICSKDIALVFDNGVIYGESAERAELLHAIRNGLDVNTKSLREVAKIVGLKHPQIVKHHLLTLANDGKLNLIDGKYFLPKD